MNDIYIGVKRRLKKDITVDETKFHINNVMKSKFGDGEYYTFAKLIENKGFYTHYCRDDLFYYHESWFEDENEEEFISENEFKIGD